MANFVSSGAIKNDYFTYVSSVISLYISVIADATAYYLFVPLK